VLDIKIPAPMVAASATAILIDINLSALISVTPTGVKFDANPQSAGFAHAFLTARVNRMVSTGAPPGPQQGPKKRMLETK
jgi:hypothetical protein